MGIQKSKLFLAGPLTHLSGARAVSCLSDENLAALVDGLADAEQTDAWNQHIDSCDSCAARLLPKQN